MIRAELSLLARNIDHEKLLTILDVLDRVGVSDAVAKIVDGTDPRGTQLLVQLSEIKSLGHGAHHPHSHTPPLLSEIPRPYSGSSGPL